MDFNPNKTPIEVIREGAFGGTYFRDTYSGINENWYKNSWKEFVQLQNIYAKFCASDYYDVNVNKYGVKCGTSLRFWENKGWINKIDPYGWFQWYFRYWFGRRSKDDERRINRWEKLWVGIGVNWWRWLEMLLVNFMIIQFRLKLDKFYCIGVTN